MRRRRSSGDTIRVLGALALTPLGLAIVSASSFPADHAAPPHALSITVVGESMMGPQYGRHVGVARTASGWSMTHDCLAMSPTQPCGCAGGTRAIPETDVRKLVAFLSTLEDGGSQATCCDHPYTIIEQRDPAGRRTTITVGFDVLGLTEVFNLCGSPVVPLDPHDGGSLLRLGHQLAGVWPKKAMVVLEQAIRLDPTRVEAYEELGRTYSFLEKYDKALAALRTVLKARPNDPRVLLQVGEVQEKVGRPQEALEAYQRARAMASTEEMKRAALSSLGDLYKELGRFDEAAAVYQDLLRSQPHDEFTRYYLGQVLVARGDLTAALKQYRVLKTAKFQYADDLQIEIDQRRIRDSPENPEAHLALGNTFYSLGRYADAIEPYRAVTRLKPELGLPYSRLGYAYAQQGRYEEAIEALQQAVRLHAEAKDFSNLGLVYFYAGRAREALPPLTEAVRRDPRSVDYQNNLGSVLQKLGRNEEALDVLAQAVRLDPTYWMAQHNLGLVYLNLRRYADAATALHQAVRLQPADPDLRFQLGRAYQELGRDREAIETLKKAVELKPNFSEAYFELGRSYVRVGDRQATGQVYEELMRLDQNQAAKLQSLMAK